jgi:prevent-host-death family protein
MVNIHEAKTHLSRLLKQVEQGEEITIARHGKPIAKIVAIPEERPNRRIGGLKGKIWLADDWDSPETNAEIQRMFDEALEDDGS